jgi:hypothetical protein
MPALEPNPTRHSTNTSPAVAGEWVAFRTAANESSAAVPASTSSPMRIAANPTWVITAYHRPADTTSARRPCSASTSSNDASAISSQHTSRVPILPAAGTSSIATTKTGNAACTARPSNPCARV